MGKIYTVEKADKEKKALKLSEAKTVGDTILIPENAIFLTINGGQIKVVEYGKE